MSQVDRRTRTVPQFAARGLRRRLHRRAALVVGIVLVVLGLSCQQAVAEPIVLTNDASGPLFTQRAILPGKQPSACVEIAYRDTEDGAAIGLFLNGARGGLNDYLRIHIEVGTGGRYGDCSGFVGHDLFTGSFADLAAEHGSAQNALRTDRLDGRRGAISYRLTLELADDNRAQGKTSQAAFTWVTTYALPTSQGSSEPSSSPTPPGPGGPSTTIDLQDSPSGSTAPSTIDRILQLVKQALFAVAKGSVFSLIGLVLVMVFLAVHSRLDRRDQKLANAPLTPTFLGFEGPYRPRGTS